MVKTTCSVFAVLSIVVAFLAGHWYAERGRVEATTAAPALAVHYTCPMHPAIVQDHPGDCPACGMALVEKGVEAAREGLPTGHHAGDSSVAVRAPLAAGIETMEVRTSEASRAVRAAGRVVADETRSYTVNAGIDGFVREVSAVTTGDRVKKGQVLARFSAPDAIPAIQAFIVAMNAMDRLKESGGEGAAQAVIASTSSNLQQRVEKLQDLGMSDRQIDEMRRTHMVPRGIEILAPADGLVLSRNISVGQRFNRGTEWFTVADLSRVWIITDVLGAEASRLQAGMRVTVSLPDRRRTLDASIADILEQYDPATRSMKVRLEVDNRDYLLRPEMLVDVEFPLALPAAVVVPTDAVLDSGLRQTVYVERQPGVFEPRDVTTGWRIGGEVEIVRGLQPGERIAATGTFLLDSESRMRMAAKR